MFHLLIIISYRLFKAIYICATIFNFGDKSMINESNLRQMEHVLHSIDFFIEISERFW